MRNIGLDDITEAVISHGDGGKKNPRLYEIYAAFIRHIHAFAREVKLTEEELNIGRQFFTQLGRPHQEMPDGEVHLFTDLIGLSTLVSLMNAHDRGKTTEPNFEGPLFVEGAPVREFGAKIIEDKDGDPLFVSGRVTDESGVPATGVVLDVWQPNSKGFYDVQDPTQPKHNGRGKFRIGEDGRFAFQTVIPLGYGVPISGPCGKALDALGRHNWRPAHIHFILRGRGYVPLTTMAYIEGARLIDSDTVFSVKNLVIAPVRHDDKAEMVKRGVDRPFYTTELDFVVRRKAQKAAAE